MEPAQINLATERRGRDRRKHDHMHGLTDDGSDYTADEIEFMKAIDAFKRDHCRPFPTWREVLEVLRGLGYRKG